MDSQTDKVNDALRILMKKNNVTQDYIASLMKHSLPYVTSRFTQKKDWTISDLSKITKAFGFQNIVDFFKFAEANNEYKHKLDALIPSTTDNKRVA